MALLVTPGNDVVGFVRADAVEFVSVSPELSVVAEGVGTDTDAWSGAGGEILVEAREIELAVAVTVHHHAVLVSPHVEEAAFEGG